MRNETHVTRQALAEADHRNLLDPPSLLAQIRPGQPGGRALRKALAHHLPELATAESELERPASSDACVERAGLPDPRGPTPTIEGFKVDALCRDHHLIVELDGHATHANAPANETDRRARARS